MLQLAEKKILKGWEETPKPPVHFNPHQHFMPLNVAQVYWEHPTDLPQPKGKIEVLKPVVEELNKHYTLPFQPYDYQSLMINALGDKSAVGLWAEVGSGKAQPLDAKVLTPSGWRLMGDMQIGDEVIAYDGQISRVTGVFPQGEKEIFEVVFSDGSKTECCEEHLWYTQTEDAGKSEGSVKSLATIRATLNINHKIPLVSGIELPEQPTATQPYFLGLVLGNGFATSKSGLYRSHIPTVCLKGSFKQRLDFLHGLMDTLNGYNSGECNSSIFYTLSSTLAEDVIELVNSLGGIVTKTFGVIPPDREIDEDFDDPYWQVNIKLPSHINPFCADSEKAKQYQTSQHDDPARYITEIRSVGMKQAQCIMIDHPEHLYVTDNYIVTHNTLVGACMALYHRIQDGGGTIMVLMPPILLLQWAKFFQAISEIRTVQIYRGTPAQRKSMNLDVDVIVMSIDIFKSDFEYLYDFYLDKDVTLIVDEAVSVKNPRTANHRCVMAFHTKDLTAYETAKLRGVQRKARKAEKIAQAQTDLQTQQKQMTELKSDIDDLLAKLKGA